MIKFDSIAYRKVGFLRSDSSVAKSRMHKCMIMKSFWHIRGECCVNMGEVYERRCGKWDRFMWDLWSSLV